VGPLIRSEKAIDTGFGNSIMAYLYKEFGNKVQTRLQIQYRSNEKIMKWSSETFYDSELQVIIWIVEISNFNSL
jgi:superfamily I DNA and/or RNA helicase